MKKLVVIAFSIFLLGSCKKEKDLANLNIDPKHPATVPSYTLFTQAQLNLSNTVTSSNVNLNIFRLIEQYWTETTYTDESNYDLGTRAIPDGWWNAFYRDVLNNFEQSKNFAKTDVTDADIQKNDLALIDIQEVYAFYYLVNTYGNIPYSQALSIDNPFPKYDDAATIYSDLLTRLDADIAALNTSAESFGGADIVYNGDVSKWKKFANSLKLKMGILIADADPAKAKTAVEAAAPNVFTSNDDNAVFTYLASPPNTNPIWVDLVQSGRQDFVAANTIVNMMSAMNDPRIPAYFTTDASGSGYSGGVPGKGNSFPAFSKPGSSITSPDFPGLLLDYSEVEFALAEAVERGFSVGGTAATHYNNAVTASITYWGGSAGDAIAYLAQPSVAYATATGTYKQKIGNQLYIALYNRGLDEWIAQRRLDFPVITAPTTALSEYPVRFTYPVKEQNVNQPNYEAASAAMGGDLVTSKLFWDKF